MTTREQAMQWWNDLPTWGNPSKEYYIGLYYSDDIVTDERIEEIWRKETKTEENIYLNRLKEQYKESLVYEVRKSNRNYRELAYNAMRLFCLDTQLVSFNDIEANEVFYITESQAKQLNFI